MSIYCLQQNEGCPAVHIDYELSDDPPQLTGEQFPVPAAELLWKMGIVKYQYENLPIVNYSSKDLRSVPCPPADALWEKTRGYSDKHCEIFV